MPESNQPEDAYPPFEPERGGSVPFAQHWLDPEGILGNMPLLAGQAKVHAGSTLKEFHFVFILHFLRDLLGLMRAFRRVGLQPSKSVVLYKPYMYPYLEIVRRSLEVEGYWVAPLRLAERIVRTQINEAPQAKSILVVEDGGYIVPLIHDRLSDQIGLFLGAVEQTARGIGKDENLSPILLPIYDVARSQWKDQFESPEIARVAVDNIRRLLRDIDTRGRPALIIGYGRIGSRIANTLRVEPHNMRTCVYDQVPRRRAEAARDGHETRGSLLDVIKLLDRDEESNQPKVVVGVTGETSIGQDGLLAMPSGTYLISVSSDQLEIGVEHLRQLSEDPRGVPVSNGIRRFRIQESGRDILLVAEGYPVNFWNVESLPNQVSDLVLTPIFKCTLDLASRPGDLPPGIYTKEVDQLIDRQGLAERYLEDRGGGS